MRVARLIATCILGFATTSFVIPSAVAQQSVAEFYNGKTITILLGHPPGGSYDLYARLAAAHLGKYIPGHPSFQVQYRPGGGGVVAVAFFHERAARDGTMMGLFAETIAPTQLIDPQIGKWKVQDFEYVGSFANVNAVFVMRKGSPAKTIEELKRIPTNVGCVGKVGQSYINPAVLNAYGGFKFKIICGYPGSADYPMALSRGEVDLVSSAWNNWSRRPEVIDGSFTPIIQSGLRRHKDLQSIPLMQELIEGQKQKQVTEFVSAGSAIGRALLVPGAVPAERIAALRNAFDKVVKDPDFIRDAEKSQAELDPTPGVEVQAISLSIVNTPKEIIDMAIEAQK